MPRMEAEELQERVRGRIAARIELIRAAEAVVVMLPDILSEETPGVICVPILDLVRLRQAGWRAAGD